MSQPGEARLERIPLPRNWMSAPDTRQEGTVFSAEMSSGRTIPESRMFCFSLFSAMSCSPDTRKLPLASTASMRTEMRASKVPLRSICPPPAKRLSKPASANWISPSRCLKVALADQNVIDKFADLGTTPAAEDQVTPEAHTAKLEEQIDLWTPIIEESGVTGG